MVVVRFSRSVLNSRLGLAPAGFLLDSSRHFLQFGGETAGTGDQWRQAPQSMRFPHP
jgi:hypothetical protein